jgi:hypothetical protein
LFQEDVPDAILIGFKSPEHYRELENPLEAFARARRYEKVDRNFGVAPLYVRQRATKRQQLTDLLLSTETDNLGS